MTVADLIDYLLARDATHDLAMQLAYVDEMRRRRHVAAPVGTGR